MQRPSILVTVYSKPRHDAKMINPSARFGASACLSRKSG
jgi:hypothetical protein